MGKHLENVFYLDPQKQAVELAFSRKKIEIDHPVILFNNIPVKRVVEHKHLGIILDSKLSFSAHIKSAISKTRKGIGLLKYLSKYLPTCCVYARAAEDPLRPHARPIEHNKEDAMFPLRTSTELLYIITRLIYNGLSNTLYSPFS